MIKRIHLKKMDILENAGYFYAKSNLKDLNYVSKLLDSYYNLVGLWYKCVVQDVIMVLEINPFSKMKLQKLDEEKYSSIEFHQFLFETDEQKNLFSYFILNTINSAKNSSPEIFFNRIFLGERYLFGSNIVNYIKDIYDGKKKSSRIEFMKNPISNLYQGSIYNNFYISFSDETSYEPTELGYLGEQVIQVSSSSRNLEESDENLIQFFESHVSLLLRPSLCYKYHNFLKNSKSSFPDSELINVEDVSLREISLYLEGKIWYDFQDVRETLS
ncbi:MAG: hypothetical protein O2U61_05020, partial [Candidatus Bathyarchaeota archaeon]|nr:hypothetical protein [Candidatus Bathyarchaeota archaeon]